MKQPRILTVAGSDSCAGAGLQADLKVITALGCYCMTAATLITTQNTLGIQAIYPLPAEIIEAQICSIFDDIEVDAVKIGALHNSHIIDSVANKLNIYNAKNIVLDPVIFSKNMSQLLKIDAVQALKTHLIPLSKIVTPNIHEAEILSGISIKNKDDMIVAGKIILDLECESVLIKGGHMNYSDKAIDCLVLPDHYEFMESPRIPTNNTHGTGCSLSSAIATFLAGNISLLDAVKMAKQYITQTINDSTEEKLGSGNCGLKHFSQCVLLDQWITKYTK